MPMKFIEKVNPQFNNRIAGKYLGDIVWEDDDMTTLFRIYANAMEPVEERVMITNAVIKIAQSVWRKEKEKTLEENKG